MGRLGRIIRNPTKYLSVKYIINNVIGGRLFILWLNISPLISSDRLYIKVFYRLGMGKKLNLNNPRTFSEKLQWLKLHNTNPIFSRMVDKYSARKIVIEKIGREYLIPLIGVWDCYNDINFDNLPDEFVLKTTHDSGTVIICNNKVELDYLTTKVILNKSLKRNYFYKSREYPYKYAKPRIIAEKLLKDSREKNLIDYKFFCFAGKPTFLLVVTKEAGRKCNSWYDSEFNPLQINTGFPSPAIPPLKPKNFSEMLIIAEKLSQGQPHIRIDLYNIQGKIYFGEFTFHHSGGVVKFNPPVWDKRLGELITLP